MGAAVRYIKDVIYGANDGLITTFAVIASVIGAELGTRVILIIGSASLLADGISMAASDYLASTSERSAMEQAGDGSRELARKRPLTASTVTFAAFVAAGALPLLPFVFIGNQQHAVWLSSAAMATALFTIGATRTRVTGRTGLFAGVEMLVIGGTAAAIAFLVARYVSALTPEPP